MAATTTIDLLIDYRPAVHIPPRNINAEPEAFKDVLWWSPLLMLGGSVLGWLMICGVVKAVIWMCRHWI